MFQQTATVTRFRFLCLSFVLGILVSVQVVDQASGAPDESARLQNAVMRMNEWLHGSKESEAWRRFLNLNVLETQAALGSQADVSTLVDLHYRFSYPNPGMEHGMFRDVRDAISEQIKNLNGAQHLDLSFEVAKAMGDYQPISQYEIQRQRDLAKYNLLLMQSYYRTTTSSRKRSDLFSELDLDNSIETLGAIRVQMPPEFSVGKTESMIQDVREQLEEIEKKIDELPLPTENGEDDRKNKADDQTSSSLIESLGPPQPDEEADTLEDLEAKQKKMEAKIKILKDQRKEYLKKDGPRRKERARIFNSLRRLENKFKSLGKEIGNPYFAAAAMSLERFTRTYYYGTSDNLQEDYLLKLRELEKHLGALDLVSQNPAIETDAAGEVGYLLSWFENSNQAKRLVNGIRFRYSLPNAYVHISSELINRFGGQLTSETRPLNEPIDGRMVKGCTRLNGVVGIELQDDPNQVHASIHFNGNVASQTQLVERRLRIYVDASGQLEARRSIYANIGGVFAGVPYANAYLETFLKGTSSRLRIVNRIAAKQFAKLKNKNETSAANDTCNQLLERFSNQTEQPIRTAQAAIGEGWENGFAKSNMLPAIYLHSTPYEIAAVAKKSTITTLGANTRPTPRIKSDASVQIHETMPSNYLDAAFSGRTFTNKELEEEIRSMFGESLESDDNKGSEENLTALKPVAGEAPQQDDDAKKEAEEPKPFSITFARVRPIEFKFRGNRISIVASGRRFAQQGRKINEGLKITIHFKIKRINGRLKFERDGQASVDFLDGDSRTPSTVAFRSFLDGQLNPKTPKDGAPVSDLSIDLPENLIPLDLPALKKAEKAKDFTLNQCRAEGGWFYLGWNYTPGQAYSSVVDTPAIWQEATIISMRKTFTVLENIVELPLVVE